MDKRVLIVEDDHDISGLIEIHLKDMGFETLVADRGDTGLELALTEQVDFIILDIMLPGKDGLEVCRELRSAKLKTPILMLTARSEEIDKILGLEMGADDYLTKPFSIRELTARVKAILRRTDSVGDGSKENSEIIRHGSLVVDKNKRKVILDGDRIELTPKEFDLLALMAESPGKSYSRENLLNVVWGYEFAGYEHTVNSHINRLRTKIESDLSNPKYILTSWGVGYRFNDELNQ
ncbi:response regulator transcription factor [Roseivirga misakiensis]|uniref:Phosphate regulon transcriptional regulatory protein PhoB n=1 Tax=Roseivirga misakiensis TaxID=1563681 RepID=A0A1E5T667_9BACT|nr:response regulator transcription factor [Roseivirga misakiensis]OEK06850.1 DNA-binding response regulator [Roseivirga misakiensis]